MKITNYATIADKYDNNQYRVDEIRHDNDLKRYFDQNNKTEYRVLDLSCGTGLYLQQQVNHYKEMNVHWSGLDLSKQMLKKAEEKLDHVTLTKADAHNMPYSDESFDYISNNYAFHHYKDKGKVLNEIHRVLNSGGIYKLHNIAIHDMPKWWIYHYFPTAYYEDLKRFWTKDVIFNELSQREFEVNMKIEYKMQEIKVADYLHYVKNRDISILTLISDTDYEEGLEKMKYDLKNNPNKTIVNDFAEIFCVAKK
ncbi:class I SAM-dependent methyltransferase [Bacillus solimangrovi]|uniref:Methylase n=1 Tax=Bacillus solimangrovi TaxID=1305675 RepID=A0A1E5LK38_9BACI|nr:class I SAM-dependent methyltransferase [Bacillus solimangrovi]OEH94444.1 methylase [Bacillus solimangrovi]